LIGKEEVDNPASQGRDLLAFSGNVHGISLLELLLDFVLFRHMEPQNVPGQSNATPDFHLPSSPSISVLSEDAETTVANQTVSLL
jgi:hypothetical protein